MTTQVLFGKATNFTSPSESGAYASDVMCYFTPGYVATADGISDTCFFRPGPIANWASSTGAKIVAYNNIGIQLGTAIFLPAQGADWISSLWDAPFPTTGGLVYYPGVIPQASSLPIVNSGNSFECNTAAGTYTYASPPTTIAPGTDAGNTKSEFNVYAFGSTAGGLIVGSIYARQRPVGRGPQMNRNITAFKRTQGAIAARQILLQLFSSVSPPTPMANTPVTLWTCLNEAGPAIDGPIQLTTDSQGFVLLQSLAIPAVLGQVRCLVTGDVTRSRNFTVQF